MPHHIDEPLSLQLLDILVGRLPANADVIGEPLLAGEAKIIVPGVGDQSRIGHFGAHGNFLLTKDGIGHLGKALLGEAVGAF